MKRKTQIISQLQTLLSEEVRAILSQKQMKQTEIAACGGCHPDSIGKLLRGTRTFSDEWLSRMHYALQTYSPPEPLFHVRQRRQMEHIATAVRNERLFALVSGNTGIGKTTALRDIFGRTPETFYLQITDDCSWTNLLQQLATACGLAVKSTSSEVLLRQISEQLVRRAQQQPLLIIDGAEVLSLQTFSRLKALHLSTERQTGILIASHVSLKKRMERAIQTAHREEESSYMPFWRRLTHFTLPPVSEEDVKQICEKDLQVRDPEVTRVAQQYWTNYGTMNRDLLIAKRAEMNWHTMSANDFQFLRNM